MPNTPTARALGGIAVLVLALAATACGGETTQTGLAPTKDWPSETPCPPSLVAVCEGKTLTLYGTINEPAGTTYGIASSDDDVFVICRWPEGAPASTCDRIGATGAQVVGEAAVYRVEGD